MTAITVNRYSTIQAARDEKLAQINAACEAELAGIRAQYPQAEIDSWPQQELEAAAWTANNATPTPLLDAIATARGVTKADLVTFVQANATAFKALAGAAFGKRQALRAQIDAATTVRDVLLISW